MTTDHAGETNEERPGAAVVLGVGPGLGLAMASRFGRAGHPVAVVSRSADRHPAYLERLRSEGTTAIAEVADVLDPGAQAEVLARITERLGPIEVLYFGPAAMDPDSFPVPIEQVTGESALRALTTLVPPAVDAVTAVLPAMRARGRGVVLLPTGLSAVRPMPPLGNLALASAALHTYAVTLHAALAGSGVFVGSLVIGGGVRGGDIYTAMSAQAVDGLAESGLDADQLATMSLDPDEIADAAWQLATRRESAEEVFSVIG
ncbi:NADP-dependent 3-hydroxy acid dehydrogenase YdfG [Promicromonospora sp. AC04]|uniref:SDR family NAD(P)-dependent oxidoreductase n=1 Tax=Promicromonospora sp. AC04 TaxID=2135723 RepID=UPI000D4EB611|nr:SDR family NAD(P)-dependent oxidoreductase [Promicromonospora sp. AC04]PUB26278.1 NADP-dependent 3-hydroxy acid dehydrogenase YdfG [Promicromonospora sp. AC04]